MDINNMTLLDFVGDDIWIVCRGGSKRRAHYEVKLFLSDHGEESGKGRRVTITFREKAYELTKQYSRVWISSFSKIGNDKIVLFRVTSEANAKGSYTLSRAKKSEGISTIQFVPPEADIPYYEHWNGGYYKLNKMSDDVFYIQFSDREV